MIPTQYEYQRRRLVVEEALLDPERRRLSNNALRRCLGVSVQLIRWRRRLLESAGVIPAALVRVGRDGRNFDVAVQLEHNYSRCKQENET